MLYNNICSVTSSIERGDEAASLPDKFLYPGTPLRACDVGEIWHALGACVSMGGLDILRVSGSEADRVS